MSELPQVVQPVPGATPMSGGDVHGFGPLWDGLDRRGVDLLSNPFWRSYCDALHVRLIQEWLGAGRLGMTLKTDLYEEALGDGLAGFLMRSGAQLHGIDLSERIVERARIRYPLLTAGVADVRALPVASGSLDLVVCISTLDHFEGLTEVRKGLAELVRVLAPGGRLFITFDNPLNPAVAFRNRLPSAWFGRSVLLPYPVGATLSEGELGRVLSELGMTVTRSGYVMHVPRVAFLHGCRRLDVSAPGGRRMLRFMMSLERLGRLPTAPWTGHFVAALAEKPGSGR